MLTSDAIQKIDNASDLIEEVGKAFLFEDENISDCCAEIFDGLSNLTSLLLRIERNRNEREN